MGAIRAFSLKFFGYLFITIYTILGKVGPQTPYSKGALGSPLLERHHTEPLHCGVGCPVPFLAAPYPKLYISYQYTTWWAEGGGRRAEGGGRRAEGGGRRATRNVQGWDSKQGPLEQ